LDRDRLPFFHNHLQEKQFLMTSSTMTTRVAVRSFALVSLLFLPGGATHPYLDQTSKPPSVFVTRLHRFEHTGIAAMIEAEERWHSGDDLVAKERRKGHLRSKAEGAPHRMTHSSVQVAALQQHQKLAADEWEAELARVQMLAEQENEEDAKAVLKSGGDLRASLREVRQHRRQHSAPSEGRAVIALSNLHSQYVGPVGVGTLMSPEGCQSANSSAVSATAIHKVSPIKEGSFTQQAHETCSVKEQSTVYVVYDTGSTNLWISSDLCKKGACVLEGRHRYNHTASYTYKDPASNNFITVTFGTGTLKGPFATDDIHIGPFTVRQQTFAMIQEQEGSVFTDVPFEGIFGMAFKSMAGKGSVPFLETMIEQKALVSNQFAFYFSPDNAAANAIFWGGLDPAFYEGEIEYFPVVDPYYWSLKMHSFRIGDEEVLGDGTWKKGDAGQTGAISPSVAQSPIVSLPNTLLQMGEVDHLDSEPPVSLTNGLLQTNDTVVETQARAIVDTGTTYYTAESGIYEKVMEKLKSGNCDEVAKTNPPITFTLGGKGGERRDYTLSTDEYMTRTEEGTHCDVAFMKIDIPKKHGPAMILGETFLRHYTGVFDRGDGAEANARVGFAKSTHGEETNKRLKALTVTQKPFADARDKKKPASKPEENTQKPV